MDYGNAYQEGYLFERTEKNDALNSRPTGSLKKIFDDPNTKRILFAGCGLGHMMFYKKEKSYGIDISENNIEFIKKSGFPKERLAVGDVRKMPYPDNFFDLIVASELVEHFSPDDFYKVTKEFDRVQRRGGYLYIKTPHPKNPRLWQDITHWRPYDLKGLIDFYKTLNYDIIQHGVSRAISKIYSSKGFKKNFWTTINLILNKLFPWILSYNKTYLIVKKR
jgi:SAM-dependent methyltransferase